MICRRQPRSSVAKSRPGEEGSALLIVFVLAAVIAIMLYQELPVAITEGQREREQLLIDRGTQYQRAIQLYFRNRKSYPPSLDALENTNGLRFLRRRYTDPLTGKADWRLLHMGPAGVMDSLVKPLNNQGGDAYSSNGSGTQGSGNSGFGSSGFGNSGFGNSGSGSSGFGSSGFGSSGFGNSSNSGFGSSGFGNSSQTNSPGTPSNTNGQGNSFTANMPTVTQPQFGLQPDTNPYPTRRAPPVNASSMQQQNANAGEDTSGGSQAQPGQGQPFPSQPIDPTQAGNQNQPPGIAGQPLNGGPGQNGMTGGQVNPNAGSIPGSGQPTDGSDGQVNTNQQNVGTGTSPQAAIANQILRTPTPSTAQSQNNPFGGGSIGGVASTVKGHSIKVINDQHDYSKWEFVYDFRKDTGGSISATQQTGAQNPTNPLGGNGIGGAFSSTPQSGSTSGSSSGATTGGTNPGSTTSPTTPNQ